jgi:hypothetical protein
MFSLTNGHLVHTTTTKRSGETVNVCHTHYTTAVWCQIPPHIPAELRIYSRAGESVYADSTVVFVVAKAYIPAGDVPGDLLLEALHVAPFPGNQSEDGFDRTLPDFQWPLTFCLGTVTGASTDLPNGQISFPVSTSDYVRGSTKSTTLLYARSVFYFIIPHHVIDVFSTKRSRVG